MQVRPLRVAGHSGLADQLAGFDAITFAHADFGEVSVNRAQIRAVLQEDDAAVAAHFAGKRHIAVLHCGNRRADRNGDVDTVVEIGTQAQETQPKRRRDGAGDRPARDRAAGDHQSQEKNCNTHTYVNLRYQQA